MTDKYEKILEGLGELKGLTSSMGQDIQRIRTDVNVNTKDLTKHIAGVETQAARLTTEIERRDILFESQKNANKTTFSELDQRLRVVEFLPNAFKSFGKILKWVGALAGAGLAISKFLGFW